jgi:hypothetical protein
LTLGTNFEQYPVLQSLVTYPDVKAWHLQLQDGLHYPGGDFQRFLLPGVHLPGQREGSADTHIQQEAIDRVLSTEDIDLVLQERMIRKLAFRAGILKLGAEAYDLVRASLASLLIAIVYDCFLVQLNDQKGFKRVGMRRPLEFGQTMRDVPPCLGFDEDTGKKLWTIVPGQIEAAASRLMLPVRKVLGPAEDCAFWWHVDIADGDEEEPDWSSMSQEENYQIEQERLRILDREIAREEFRYYRADLNGGGYEDAEIGNKRLVYRRVKGVDVVVLGESNEDRDMFPCEPGSGSDSDDADEMSWTALDEAE